MSKPDDVVIVSAVRTPMGSFQGVFSSVSATELGAVAVKAAVQRANMPLDHVDELLFGNVLSAGLGQAPARQVALGAGLDVSTTCTTISKVCGSGMKSILLGHDQLKAASCQTVITGGTESMTQSPYFIPKARGGIRLGHAEIKDHMFFDGLEDAYSGRAMGSFAQETADTFGITRQQMDEYAIESLVRAKRATEEGFFMAEMAPVRVVAGKVESVIEVDEQPGKAQPEKIPLLRPAFSRDGTITAANSSSISDGAAALLLMTAEKAAALGLTPIAKVVAHATHAQAPGEFTLAPIGSIRKLLSQAGWTIDDVDLFEINEAFAMVPMLSMQALNIRPDRVNVNGGACALGHPIGASGARIVVTLIHALRRLGMQRGVASLCIGGGEATSIAIEAM